MAFGKKAGESEEERKKAELAASDPENKTWWTHLVSLAPEFPPRESNPYKLTPRLERRYKHIAKVAWTMDSAFRMPVLGFRFGIEPIIGLVPGLGDVVSCIIGAWIIFSAYQFMLPKSVLIAMCINWCIDGMIGIIPLVGDFFDFVYKSNTKNLRLLEKHLEHLKKDLAKAELLRKQDEEQAGREAAGWVGWAQASFGRKPSNRASLAAAAAAATSSVDGNIHTPLHPTSTYSSSAYPAVNPTSSYPAVNATTTSSHPGVTPSPVYPDVPVPSAPPAALMGLSHKAAAKAAKKAEAESYLAVASEAEAAARDAEWQRAAAGKVAKTE